MGKSSMKSLIYDELKLFLFKDAGSIQKHRGGSASVTFASTQLHEREKDADHKSLAQGTT